MKYFIVYNPKTKKALSYSKGKIDFNKDIYSSIELEISDEDIGLLRKGYYLAIENGKAVARPQFFDAQKEAEKKAIRDELTNAKTLDDIKKVINKILK